MMRLGSLPPEEQLRVLHQQMDAVVKLIDPVKGALYKQVQTLEKKVAKLEAEITKLKS